MNEPTPTHSEIEAMRDTIHGLRCQLDTFSTVVFCQIDTMQLKLSKILAEVSPPAARAA
jgi:hypothetical protein